MRYSLKLVCCIYLQLNIVSCFSQVINPVERILKQLHTPSDKKVLVTAHRGDWRNAPENSLQAFRLAMGMGVDIIELDLNRTRDGVIVIMHDETIDRTTNGKGRPSDYTLEELRKFHLKNGLGRVTNHTIPTLAEVMELVKGRVVINLDKSYHYYNEAYAILRATGTLQQAIFKTDSSYSAVRSRYPAILDSIVFMPVVYLDKPRARELIDEYQHQIKPVAFELIFQQDTSSVLQENGFINRNGSKIWMNSLWASLNAGHDDDRAVEEADKKNSWDWLLAHGATILQTDRPLLLLEYLRRKGLHD